MKINEIEYQITEGSQDELTGKGDFWITLLGHKFYIEVDCSWLVLQVEGGEPDELSNEVSNFQIDTINAYSGDDCETTEGWIEDLIMKIINN